jgi:quinol monooxygenase YgiN
MHEIQVSAKFARIPREHLAAFKLVAAEAHAVANLEAGTLQYDWFFNDDETVCVVRETYQDSNALLAHMTNASGVFARLVKVAGGCELEVFGPRSTELIEASATLRPTAYPHQFHSKHRPATIS